MATIIEPDTKRQLTERSAWKELEDHCQKVRPAHLRDLFANDGARGLRFAAEATGIYS
jgi:glucose-6-phosphate isomerase